MKFIVIFTSGANADVAEIFEYYESIRVGLGEDFLTKLNLAENRLRRFPLANRILEKNVRRALLDRFPHGIFYRVENRTVVVFTVCDLRRDPSIWKNRVE